MLKITPTLCEATYEMLRCTEPFSKWNLPEGEDVRFKVTRHPHRMGTHRRLKGKHEIEISSACVGQLPTLTETMAHEMCHMHEENTPGLCSRAAHGRVFKALAARVCKVHTCFDPKRF